MSSFELSINIKGSEFPELGCPTTPVKKVNIVKGLKPSKFEKDTFKDDWGYYESDVNSLYKDRVRKLDGVNGNDIKDDYMSLKLHFEKDISKTYKFMGMDIDEDFNAVIPIGSGAIVVANMAGIGKGEVEEKLGTKYKNTFSSKSGKAQYDEATNIINRIDSNGFRRILTRVKCGGLFSCIKNISKNKGIDRDIYLDVKEYTDLLKNVAVSSNSIILSIINEKEKKKNEIDLDSYKKSPGSWDTDSDSNSDLEEIILARIFIYWSDVLNYYKSVHTLLSTLDLWSNLGKRALGDKDFNNRMGSCCSIVDNETGEVTNRVVSFTGVSESFSIAGKELLFEEISNSYNNLALSISGRGTTDNSKFIEGEDAVDNLFKGNFDQTDVFVGQNNKISLDEMQALSSLDSLRYIDEDAELSKSSYDMKDPYDRALYVKSAIRSYERNFKDFKPAGSYDVPNTLAELVENDKIESNPIISYEEFLDKAEKNAITDNDRQRDIVTSTMEELKAGLGRRDLMKIMKLVSKLSDRILKNFANQPINQPVKP